PAGCSSPVSATLRDWVTICTTLGPTAAETRSVSTPMRSSSRMDAGFAPIAGAASISKPRLPCNHELYRRLINGYKGTPVATPCTRQSRDVRPFLLNTADDWKH